MNPTRAPETSDSTPSSIPIPARSTGQTATFFPEMRCTVVRSSGVSISTSSVGKSFVASYVRSSVTSFAILRKCTVGVSFSRKYESLCWTSGCSTTIRRSPCWTATAPAGRSPAPPSPAAAAGILLSGPVLLTLSPPAAPAAAAQPCERARSRRRSRDVGREAAEPRIERVLVAESGAPGCEGRDVCALTKRLDDDLSDLGEVLLDEAAHRRRWGSDPDSRGDCRRLLVEGHRVAVHGQLDVGEPLLRVLAGPVRAAQVELEEVRVGASGEDVEAALHQRVRERVRIGAHLALVILERLGGRDPEAGRLRGNRVLQRPALHPGEDGSVDGLCVLLAAEDEPGARPGERLVRRRSDEVAVLDRVRRQTGGDEPGEMGHVAEEQCADLVCDLPELVGLHGPGVRRPAADDQVRPVFLREVEHVVVVDHVRLAGDAVVDDRVEAAREVDLEAMCEVAAVGELERQDRVAE